jgi:hypothetical protein
MKAVIPLATAPDLGNNPTAIEPRPPFPLFRGTYGKHPTRKQAPPEQAAPLLPSDFDTDGGDEHKQIRHLDRVVAHRRRRRRHPSWRKEHMGCRKDCPACGVADKEYGMRFRHAVTLTMPSTSSSSRATVGHFELFQAWLDRLPRQAFGRMHVGHPAKGNIHAHLVVGGVSYIELKFLLSSWPWRALLDRAWDVWGALHYAAEHAQAVFITDNYGDHWRPYRRQRVGSAITSSLGGRARAAALSPERRSAIARKAAETRWPAP